jgi:hypothetical protein
MKRDFFNKKWQDIIYSWRFDVKKGHLLTVCRLGLATIHFKLSNPYFANGGVKKLVKTLSITTLFSPASNLKNCSLSL